MVGRPRLLVVTADGRGTTGRGPAWDREIFEDMKDVTLADQVEAVNALPEAVARLNADVESRAAQPAAGDQADAENHPPALRATSRQREVLEHTSARLPASGRRFPCRTSTRCA